MKIVRERTYATRSNGITIRDGAIGIQWALIDELGVVVEANHLDDAEVTPDVLAAVVTLEAWADAAIAARATAKQAVVDAEIAAAIAAKVKP